MGCGGIFEKCEFTKLNDFRERDLFTDVTLIVEGSNLRAHKAVLSARSEVFELMFTTPMTEAIQSVVNITDASKPAFEAFIRFLYTNSANYEVVDEHYAELLYLADKYLVGNLTKRCSEHLESRIGEDRSLVELLSLAECYKMPTLKERLFTYLSREGEEYSKSKDFEKLVADFRFSEMVVSGITPTTISKTIDFTPDWNGRCVDEFIEIRNNGNIVTMKVGLKCRRKTLYGSLEVLDSGYWNQPVEMSVKFTVSSTDGTLMHSDRGDVWWECRIESDDEWESGSEPERKQALFEYRHQPKMAFKNTDFVFCITLSHWVTPVRIYKKRKVPKPNHEDVGPSKAAKIVGEPSVVDQASVDKTSHRSYSFLENDGNCDHGLDATTLLKLQQHVSSGSLPEESEVNASLILGAHKFSLTGLVQHCEKVIASRVDAENAVDTIILARQLNLEKLECTAVDFIDFHQLEVVASKGWPRLKDYPELVATILKKMLSKPAPFEPLFKESRPKIILSPEWRRRSDSS